MPFRRTGSTRVVTPSVAFRLHSETRVRNGRVGQSGWPQRPPRNTLIRGMKLRRRIVMKMHAKFGMGVLSLGMMAVPGLAGAQEHRGEDLPNPMQLIRLVQTVGKTVFMAADVNHDDQISQKEAIDAANTMVGGYFFQAGRDGNGVVSQEEAKAVSDYFFNQNPWMRYVWQTIQSQQKSGQNNTNQAN